MKLLLKIPLLLGYSLFYLKELLLANYTVAKLVLTPGMNIRPAMFALPLSCTTDAQILLLANLISMTPGTLSVDVSTDKKTLYIHVIDVDDLDGLRTTLKEQFERRVITLLS
ncbi:sodium:proton antiporter [Phragmitibacter flavus]|uniref:Sodium:proton antiporter n=1 Tax=Phragmitibacter flavus TaxID=2576071 RepID=A0A5R8KA18_9BACT|nr:Na+/H+ antiporter subunit E [Phragmitibacter flavus]TLD69160.1 sodium:proton antiporter [Phragmitibacter flavus]